MPTHGEAARLEIIWDGDAPGVAEHRLSLGAFGNSLNRLLAAYKRIASNMLREAADADLPDKRLRKKAKWLDIQIESISEGSVGISAVGILAPPPGAQTLLFEEISGRAGVELLDAIKDESEGHLRSNAVRKFLAALPEGVTHQSYKFQSNDYERAVSIGELRLAESPAELPYLVDVEGKVIAVGFDPGESFVTIDQDGQKMRIAASEDQVEQALQLRDHEVTAFVVNRRGRNRLLSLRDSAATATDLTDEERERVLFGKWDGLLRRLAE